MNHYWAVADTGWDTGGVIYFGCLGVVMLVLLVLVFASRRR
jgi:hypothetical protein